MSSCSQSPNPSFPRCHILHFLHFAVPNPLISSLSCSPQSHHFLAFIVPNLLISSLSQLPSPSFPRSHSPQSLSFPQLGIQKGATISRSATPAVSYNSQFQHFLALIVPNPVISSLSYLSIPRFVVFIAPNPSFPRFYSPQSRHFLALIVPNPIICSLSYPSIPQLGIQKGATISRSATPAVSYNSEFQHFLALIVPNPIISSLS
jgi:hypothetical protein